MVKTPPTAANLQKVEDYLGRYEDWTVTFLKAETAAWRFRIESKGRSTETLLPFTARDSELRKATGALILYFDLMSR